MSETPKRRKKYVKRSRAVEKAVLKFLAAGLLPPQIEKRPNMPSKRQIYAWAADTDSAFSREYARARPIGYAKFADEIVEIADESSNDWIETKHGPVFNKEAAMRSQLRIDTRKWLLSKALPKIYGDKLDVSAKHEAGDSFKNIWAALGSGTLQLPKGGGE